MGGGGSKQLMRDPDQIGSQMINKLGGNNSLLIFGPNSVAHNNSSAGGASFQQNLNASSKLTQSNRLHAVSNFSPMK